MLTQVVQDISRYRNAYFLTFSAMMGSVLSGWDSGMTGGVLALKSFQHYFGFDKKSPSEFANFSGNIAGILPGGSFFGALFSSYAIGRIGRKHSLVLAAVINFTGTLIESIAGLGASPEVGLRVLYFGRFLCGFGTGISTSAGSAYVPESVPPVIRGRCVGTLLLTSDIGLMLSYWVNYGSARHIPFGEMQWRILFIVQLIPGIIYIVSMLLQPESPRWLVEHERYDMAANSLAYINGTTPEDEEVSKTIQQIRDDFVGREKLSVLVQIKRTVETRSIALRCSIAVLVMVLEEMTGTNAMSFYGPQVFGTLGLSSDTTGLLATGVYGVVKVVCVAIFLALALENTGRKNSLIIGGIGQGLTMLWIGGYNALHPTGKIGPAGYVSIVAVYLYGIFFCIGWGIIPWVIAGEVPPNHLRSVVVSFAWSVNFVTIFTLSKVIPIMLDKITYGTYVFFGVWCIIAAAWAYIFLPETTGYQLEDIKHLFESDVILRSLQDAPGGRIFIGKRRAKTIEELRAEDNLEVTDKKHDIE